MPDLFSNSQENTTESTQPLAARMRPRTLDEFTGQQHILGPDSVLRKAIQTGDIPSMILYGPPGCGKTTLATIIQSSSPAAFESFSAVTSGVADIREVIARARERRKLYGQNTILFVDEIHRFNKAQQDAFLPHIEDGTIVLIGATTENPFFSINTPLLSRSRVFQFESLSPADIRQLILRALEDPQRGLGGLNVDITDEALDFLVEVSGGDARTALNGLEVAARTALQSRAQGAESASIEKQTVSDALQKQILSYDKSGDAHYDAISAFIKSMRGSDPDAAVYWLARMLAAGEDPRFVARRMVIQASEDIGNADPMALVVATSAAHAVELVGMPEAQIPLAQAAIYLACAPKSNASYLAINQAMEAAKSGPQPRVPPHLRGTGYKGAQALGSGAGYLYPHDFPGHIVQQDYLPKEFRNRKFYKPTDIGLERKIAERLNIWKQELKSRKRTESEPRD